MVEEAMDLLEAHTCIEFIEKTSEKNYVYISYTEKGCFSHVGMVKRGRQVCKKSKHSFFAFHTYIVFSQSTENKLIIQCVFIFS